MNLWEKQLNYFILILVIFVKKASNFRKDGLYLFCDYVNGKEKETFELNDEPEKITIKKQFIYSGDMWDHGSVIVPNAELINFRRINGNI